MATIAQEQYVEQVAEEEAAVGPYPIEALQVCYRRYELEFASYHGDLEFILVTSLCRTWA